MALSLSDLPHDPHTGGLPGRWRVVLAAHLDDAFQGLRFRGGRAMNPADGRKVRRLVAAMGPRLERIEPWDDATVEAVLASYVDRDLPPAFAHLRAAQDGPEGAEEPEDGSEATGDAPEGAQGNVEAPAAPEGETPKRRKRRRAR
ncbi:MAG: hypothetical protein RID81_07140 [Sandaracinaceae bacterium]